MKGNIEECYKFFQKNIDKIIEGNENLFVLISDSEVKAYFTTVGEGYGYGLKTFGIGNFIVQKCIKEEVFIQRVIF